MMRDSVDVELNDIDALTHRLDRLEAAYNNADSSAKDRRQAAYEQQATVSILGALLPAMPMRDLAHQIARAKAQAQLEAWFPRKVE